VKECDMKDSDLCKVYQERYTCHYASSHGVENCDYDKILKFIDNPESRKQANEDFKDIIFQGIFIIFVSGAISQGLLGDWITGAFMAGLIWINTVIIID